MTKAPVTNGKVIMLSTLTVAGLAFLSRRSATVRRLTR